MAQGGQSLSEALIVGAAIEEIDILDLEKYIAQTDKTDIQMVYENLMKGSRNHLRSFVSTIQKQAGSTYQPQYLSLEAYQAIVGSEMVSGGNGRRRGKG
jgi:tRNA isopentenyl-2-thiomethyl-A-37 hydroxylase MiaE